MRRIGIAGVLLGTLYMSVCAFFGGETGREVYVSEEAALLIIGTTVVLAVRKKKEKNE